FQQHWSHRPGHASNLYGAGIAQRSCSLDQLSQVEIYIEVLSMRPGGKGISQTKNNTHKPTKPFKKISVLVVDDDAQTCELLRSTLQDSGAKVAVAQTMETALETHRRTPCHIAIVDIRLGILDGYDLIKAIRFND